ncbi:STAS-like domain-containing protein [Photobacterium toruni]|uniref:STAS-like domain-containing protein n=1 Tax=Photobacterium toruni TaxID=1935446 RepID=A0ABU6LBY9_9GAMM|nr:STAS-like domain-containing protein [Photobacterium toruni]
MKTICVADRYFAPGPRYKILGDASGEEFREWLIKELTHDSNITVNLDGTLGYGSSFLEEAFGGLVRAGIDHKTILNINYISEEEPDLIEEICGYIQDEIDKQNNG